MLITISMVLFLGPLLSLRNDGFRLTWASPVATMELENTKDFDGNLWFFTRVDSQKVHEIEEEKDVSLAYSHQLNTQRSGTLPAVKW